MSKSKLLRFALCFFLVLCVGFSWVSSVSAYESGGYMYQPVVWTNKTMLGTQPQYQIEGENGFIMESSYNTGRLNLRNNNVYEFNLFAPYDDVNYIRILSELDYIDAMIAPNVYDYYFVLTMYGFDDTFSFSPDVMWAVTRDCNDPDLTLYHELKDGKMMHYDTFYNTGFSYVVKIPEGISSNAIAGLVFRDDELGHLSQKFYFEGLIVQTQKGSDAVSLESAILSALQDINDNTDRLEEVGESIVEAIEKQYEVAEDEDLGLGDLQDTAEEKMGVLTFGADTLSGFLGLFSAENAEAQGTKITFPAFSITIQGKQYNVWQSVSYDLSTLEDDFGVLINAVRFATVSLVWLALLQYIIKCKDTIFGG